MPDGLSNDGLYATSAMMIPQRLAAQKTGVISGCLVTQLASPGMYVKSSSGVIFISGVRVVVAANASIAINTAHGSYDRYDLISVNTSGTIVYTPGTANSTPVPPEIPASNCPLAVVYVAAAVGTILDAAIYSISVTLWDSEAPVGSINAWLKSLTGTPALPANWVECNGQTISDANSVYNGIVIPNLNTRTYPMLRGAAASGATGGADTHTLTTAEMPAHTHTVGGHAGGGTGYSKYNLSHTDHETTSSTGGGTAHNNLPAYYSVVFILRIK